MVENGWRCTPMTADAGQGVTGSFILQQQSHEWLEFSPSQRSFTGDMLTFSEQTSWNWVKFDLQWTTFWECSPISISNILHAILYPIFLLYTLYLFYIQYSICCILLHISNIYAHVLFLYSTSYIRIPHPIFICYFYIPYLYSISKLLFLIPVFNIQ